MSEELEINSCVRGYHVYQSIWTPVVGEGLDCVREPTNDIDRYAVMVVKDGTTVGHLPKKISRTCSLFLLRGGSINFGALFREAGVTLMICLREEWKFHAPFFSVVSQKKSRN